MLQRHVAQQSAAQSASIAARPHTIIEKVRSGQVTLHELLLYLRARLATRQAAAASAKTLSAALPYCIGWRQTGSCSPAGLREPAKDQTCSATIASDQSGYCLCAGGVRAGESSCSHTPFTCADVCNAAKTLRASGLTLPVGAPSAVQAAAKRVAKAVAAKRKAALQKQINDAVARAVARTREEMRLKLAAALQHADSF